MRAVDTNIIIRYILTDKDPAQAETARMVIDREPVFVSTTVLLECEWVLRRVYKIAPNIVATALERFGGLPTVYCEQPERIKQALNWMRAGLDFADAIHLAAATACREFLTFDKAFVKSARAIKRPSVCLAEAS